MKADPQLVTLARNIAIQHGLNDSLVCAIIEQESGWDPAAMRYEPAFYQHYIVPLHLAELEGKERATSYGLMQTMLQSVVEIGFAGSSYTLFDPATNLEWGCKLFQKKLLRANGDQHQALLFWNGGGNPLYPGQVVKRLPGYLIEVGDEGVASD